MYLQKSANIVAVAALATAAGAAAPTNQQKIRSLNPFQRCCFDYIRSLGGQRLHTEETTEEAR